MEPGNQEGGKTDPGDQVGGRGEERALETALRPPAPLLALMLLGTVGKVELAAGNLVGPHQRGMIVMTTRALECLRVEDDGGGGEFLDHGNQHTRQQPRHKCRGQKPAYHGLFP